MHLKMKWNKVLNPGKTLVDLSDPAYVRSN